MQYLGLYSALHELCFGTHLGQLTTHAFGYLADLKSKHFLKVCRLADEKQIESPASAEISHDDSIDWHGCKERPPGCVEFLQQKKMNWLTFYDKMQFQEYFQLFTQVSYLCFHIWVFFKWQKPEH